MVEEEEAGPSETNSRKGEAVDEPKRTTRKELKPVASVHKILKFKLLPDSTVPNSTS